MSLQTQHDACGIPPLVRLQSVSEHEHAAESHDAFVPACL